MMATVEMWLATMESDVDTSLSCAYSQFGIDVPFVGPKEQCEHIQLYMDVDDEFEQLNSITNAKVKHDLLSNSVIFDSLMQVYSAMNQEYIDVAGILTQDALYFTSASNYKMWLQFKDRTKIDDIMKRRNDIQITSKMARKLTANLDIIDIDITRINSKLKGYLVGKTLFEIKLDFMLNECTIKSLASFFGLTGFFVKSVNCIRIDNMDAIDLEYIDQFIMFVFEDIAWIDQRVLHNTNFITLKHYHNMAIIKTLNARKQEFFEENQMNAEMIIISSYIEDRRTSHHDHYSKQLLFSHKYDAVEPLNLPGIPYCFKLKQSNQKASANGLMCQLTTNNTRHEWITHLDYAIHMHPNHSISVVPKTDIDSKTQDPGGHLMNDFVFNDDIPTHDEQSDAFSKNFGFGIYLHFWETGFINSVVPKYPTLKQELLENAHAKFTTESYYDLYEACLRIYKKTNIKAADIGINNKKLKIPVGSLITVNHLISLKVYTNYSNIQLEFKKHCRRTYKHEPVESVVRRNQEIAHWCRYLKESCTFYGNTMDKDMRVFTGLNVKLMFGSLNQHFECPLSATIDSEVANRFAEGTNG
eukprot:842282_1